MAILTGVETLLELAATPEKKSQAYSNLHRQLQESIDDVLKDVLGKDVREALYDRLEREFYVDRDKIPEHLGDFFLLLERFFGMGSDTIARTVTKRLWARLNG
jgi:hypothetical protein